MMYAEKIYVYIHTHTYEREGEAVSLHIYIYVCMYVHGRGRGRERERGREGGRETDPDTHGMNFEPSRPAYTHVQLLWRRGEF